MLHLQLFADEMNRQRRADAEQLRLVRQLAALRRRTRRGRPVTGQLVEPVRKALLRRQERLGMRATTRTRKNRQTAAGMQDRSELTAAHGNRSNR